MFPFLVLLFSTLTVTAQAQLQTPFLPSDVIVSRAPDGFVRPQSQARSQSQLQTPPNCRDRIPDLLCLVDPMTDQTPDPMQRPCLDGGRTYAAVFQSHYDRSPALIREMYCHLSRIWIEKSFSGTAFATPIVDKDHHMVGGAVGVRKEILDTLPDLDAWMSWKEETSFGGSPKSIDPRMGLINYHSNPQKQETLIDYVLDHEFGHLFDFANNLDAYDGCYWEKGPDGHYRVIGTCHWKPGAFGAISWLSALPSVPKPENDYPHRKEVCFYFCNGHYLSLADAPELFTGLNQTSFPSTYASTNPMEDFAETFALYLGTRQLNFWWRAEVGDQQFDLTAHYNSDLMASKRAYVEHFLSHHPLYPGEGH